MSSPDTVLGRFVQRIEKSYPLPAFSQRAWPAVDGSPGTNATPPLESSATPASLDSRRLLEAMIQRPDWTSGLFATVRHPRFGGLPSTTLSSKSLESIEFPILAAFLYGFGLPESWFQDLQPQELQRYWQRTLYRTVALRLISLRTSSLDLRSLLPAAMVADFGMLILYKELKQTYRDFVTQARETGQDLYQMELESLGFDHRILAARLLDQWPVSSRLGAIIGRIHVLGPEWESNLQAEQNPSEQRWGDSARLGVLYAADQAARTLIDGGTENATRLANVTRQGLHWDLAGLRQWLKEIPELARYIAESFGLTPLGIEFSVAPNGLLEVEKAWAALTAGSTGRRREKSGDSLLTDRPPSGQPNLPASAQPAGPAPILARAAANTVPRSNSPPHPGKTLAPDSESGRDFFGQAIGADPRRTGTLGAGGLAATAVMPSAWAAGGSDPALLGQLQSSVELCRAQRQPLSLLLAQIDGFESLLFGSSIDEVYRWQERLVAGLCQVIESEGGRALEIAEDKFALILPGIERTTANRLGQEILRMVRQWSNGHLQTGKCGLTLSLGCAATNTPPRNFRGELLLEAAQRCLEHVQRAAGNGIKSIEVL
jgi:GGDEF domain-containing protein